jgi:hypothetical protein
MQNTLKKAILLGAMLTISSATAQAALISQDLVAPGDGLITLDTATGKQWLDLTLTDGQSYDAVTAGFGGYTTTKGFSFANTNQVATLYTDAGIPNITNSIIPADVPGVSLLLSLMGCTNYCATGADLAEGWADLPVFSTTLTDLPFIQLDVAGARALAAGAGPAPKSLTSGDVGSYLVRDVAQVPEPGIIALFSLGLVGLGCWRRFRAG